MTGWTPEEDGKLRQTWGKTDHPGLEVLFGRKYQAIWLRAKKVGLVKSHPARRHWSVKEIEKLFEMTKVMASPKELAQAFPGVALDEMIIEADRVGCDICYLKNRELIRRSVDVIIDLDLTLNFKRVNIT